MTIYKTTLEEFLTWIRLDKRNVVITSDIDGRDGTENLDRGYYYEINRVISFGDRNCGKCTREEIPDLLYAWLIRPVVTVFTLCDDEEMRRNKPDLTKYSRDDKLEFSKIVVVVQGDKRDNIVWERMVLNNEKVPCILTK